MVVMWVNQGVFTQRTPRGMGTQGGQAVNLGVSKRPHHSAYLLVMSLSKSPIRSALWRSVPTYTCQFGAELHLYT